MPEKYPIRHETHNLEEESRRYFVNHLPPNWTSHKPESDYGIDLIVDIFEDRLATGLELLVQLKGSDKGNNRDVETITLRIETFNFLWDKLQVVLLVKYVQEEKQAYWILLKDIPPPDQDNQTFTVYIPKANTFSPEAWENIKNHVRQVTDKKLAATRAKLQQANLD